MDNPELHREKWMVLILAAGVLIASQGLRAQGGAAAASAPAPAPSASPVAAGQRQSAQGPGAQASGTAAALPAWDVSTVKPSSPDARGSMIQLTPDGIKITNVPLLTVVREAFDVQDDHLLGGPSWAKAAMFDIEGKVAPEDAPKLKGMKVAQRREMWVSLLEERFGLKFHHETRDLPVYELVVAKGGPKMQASKPDDPSDVGPVPSAGAGQDPRPARHMLMMRGRGHIESQGTGMDGLARVLSGQLGRTVVDKTGLQGNFDYKLDWTPDDAVAAMTKGGDPVASQSAAAPDTAGPSLFTAVQEQLGLKLEATKGPADVIVIDRIEQPTEN